MSGLHIVMYHYTRDLKHGRYPRIKGLDYELFRQQIHFLKEQFNIISMEEAIEAADGSYDLPENALLLTFDDGYVDNYTCVLPILEEAKVQGSFFIPGKTFTTHQLLDVNKIHFILASADINKFLNDVFERMDFYRGGGIIIHQIRNYFQNWRRRIDLILRKLFLLKRSYRQRCRK